MNFSICGGKPVSKAASCNQNCVILMRLKRSHLSSMCFIRLSPWTNLHSHRLHFWCFRCACMHTYIYIHIHTYINIHIYIHIHTYTHTHIHAYIRMSIHTHIHAYGVCIWYMYIVYVYGICIWYM